VSQYKKYIQGVTERLDEKKWCYLKVWFPKKNILKKLLRSKINLIKKILIF